MTDNLARVGAWDTDAIAWSQWVNSPAEVLGAWGDDGHVYSKKGVAPALAYVPIRYLARFIPAVGLLQTTFLVNALITIATALLLWAIAPRLGYSEKLGAALAVIFGLATLAWPYATHLFGEPLSALALTTALWALLRFRQEGGGRSLLWVGLALGISVATSAAYALLLPVFGIYWLWAERQRGVKIPQFSHWLALAAPLALTALFLLWYNNLRFGHPLDSGYHFEAGEGFNGPLLAGLYGLLISPYRGLLFHQPLTLLSLIGFIPFYRRHRPEALLTGVISVMLVFVFAKWWIWWGGFAWGPRFLVPLAPYLVLWLAPLLAGTYRRIVWIAVALSALIQLLAVSANYVLWEIELRGLYPTDWTDPLRYGAPATSNPLHSPVVGQIHLLARQAWTDILDFAWFQPNQVVWWVPAIGLGIVIVAGWQLLCWWRGRSPGWLPAILMLALIPFTWFTLHAYAQSERYGTDNSGYSAILKEIDRGARLGDTLVTVTPYHYQIPMNRYNGDLPILGFAQEEPLRPETERLLGEATGTTGTLYLVTAGLPPADPSNAVELWLNEHTYLATDQWYDDFRLLRYGTVLPTQSLDSGQVWGNPPLFTLDQASISTRRTSPGSVLSLDLRWLSGENQPDTHLFVQLLPTDAAPIAQFDRPYPTSTWQPGEIYNTAVALWIPPDAPSADYTLIAGWYDPTSAERFITDNKGDYATLGTIHITP
ncbi:MAG: hypothetical protein GY759_14160 [Chloroflexi bacterium]|nr:hypothetical protein [Chloroflexota bacterium]